MIRGKEDAASPALAAHARTGPKVIVPAGEARLAALRAQLKADGLDGFVVPLSDEHMSEYVGGYAQRLAWLTGFQGSAGTAAVLPDSAAIFTDGRYALQVRSQVDPAHWRFQSVPDSSVAGWLAEHAGEGARIGYDPWVHSMLWVGETRDALAEVSMALIPVRRNPIDAIWPDRPAPSRAPITVHADRFTGRASAEKRAAMADWLKAQKADAVLLSALDSIAWTFNIRGSDIAHTPVALAFALVHDDATADLFVDGEKLGEATRRHLGEAVRLHERRDFAPFLERLGGKTIAIDPEWTVAAIDDALERAGAKRLPRRDPSILPRSIKNPVEIDGHRKAHARDGAGLTRFLHWLSIEARTGALDERGAAAALLRFRENLDHFKDLTFETVSGYGPNGAIVHYQATRETSRMLVPGSLYLVDSGVQYLDGTTDITRTVAIGTSTAEMRDRFTRVLKGHIALATAVFPEGTRGSQLDSIARHHLWEAGLDYPHGTGHGVGSYLSGHEGPQRICPVGSSQAGGAEPLRAGMIVSNEPGYYKTGDYGIRIENLVLVVPVDVAGAERPMLGFETLSFAPIDRTLIEASLLPPEMRRWLDGYHARVLDIVGPQLEGAARTWLEQACAPIAPEGAAP